MVTFVAIGSKIKILTLCMLDVSHEASLMLIILRCVEEEEELFKKKIVAQQFYNFFMQLASFLCFIQGFISKI